MATDIIYSTREHKFIIKEWLDTRKILGFSKFKDFDVDDFDPVLDEALRFVKGEMPQTLEDGENIGPKLIDGKVHLPPSWHQAYWKTMESGWGPSDPEKEDALPTVVTVAWWEYFHGANHPFFMISTPTIMGAAEMIAKYGRPVDKEVFLPKMYSGLWNATMALTEANAGSDVGDVTSKAVPTGEPQVYKITGTKCFITSGDQDINENIIHMTLARVEGAAPGTKGLSLFIVPKFWSKEDGTLEPNDVTTVSIEHKLGYKGSPTCVLSYGEEGNCRGILLGNPPDENGVGEGMTQMFTMMNGKRYEMGINAVGVGQLAYNYAVDYAKVRVQGKSFTNPRAPRVRLIEHEDIRRMLLNVRATTEAIRAMLFKAAYYRDLALYSDDEEERRMATRRVDMLNPLIKGYCGDYMWPVIADAIQVLGGYGFSEEYPIARLARDSKFFAIAEGTSFIQSIDLVGRKWSLEKGRVYKEWFDEVVDYIENNRNTSGLEQEFAILEDALENYKKIYDAMNRYLAEDRRMVPLYSTRVMHASAILYSGMLLLDMAKVAQKKIGELGADHWEYNFYQGKILTAKYYIKNMVAQIQSLTSAILSADTSAIEFPEAAF
ncbi:MAG TPA: acyl-CoA dehydrogenase [Anaerovoracaceae bacterium]|nr:acyl-CoA dehydrogenase [Anaerovoracaceae bacterium]